ncbi:TetR/AcrR family transcriptional regulator [Methylococcus capsulatus]|nr:TetR/AcrR family transcriptional regulator [Methylococcus capsulatus]QXP88851.1 TetR/AcrR family transcriptional regulator [Methylococcus capsulatus]QXP94115.1 TetR/AcrR family transcriptional regulator [Methylococcus capsulatus]UQN11144.1 TetR/AcrR family transcriptional regulator [Methylococcus capsulatus]
MAKTATKQLIRERLLNEGVALLMEQGYHGTGLQDILHSVGVPKGSFYNYFTSKEEFGAEVIRHYIEPFILQLDGHLRNSALNGAQALQAYFHTLIGEAARRQFKGGCLLGNLMGEIGDTSDTCREALREALHRYRDKLAQGIARAQSEGAFRRDRTAEDLADCLVDAWQGALLRMKVEQSVRPLEECCRNLLEGYFRA